MTAPPAWAVIQHAELTAAGRLDPVFGPEYGGLGLTTVPCVHRHADTFSLPVGAVHLAATRAYPHQAFRSGHRAYGLQFHVEGHPDPVGARRTPPADGSTPPDARLIRVATVGRRLVTRLLAAVGRADPAPVVDPGPTG